jgi:membrane-associated protein
MVGALDVPARTFTIWQVVGGLIWSVGVTLLGYALGSTIGNVDKYLLPIIAVIVVLSLVPIVIEIVRDRRSARSDSRADDQDRPVPFPRQTDERRTGTHG